MLNKEGKFKKRIKKSLVQKTNSPKYSWGDISTINTESNLVESKSTSNGKRWNLVFLYILIFVAFTTLVVSLFDLQIVRGQEFTERAENNRIKKVPVPADRGVMFDRNGVQLVLNKPSFHVVLNVKNVEERLVSIEEWERIFSLIYEDVDTGKLKDNLPEELPLPALTEEGERYFSTLAKILEVDKRELVQEFIEGVGVNKQKEVVLKKNVSRDQQILIKARKDEFPGLSIKEVSDREYPYTNLFSHVIGYTGEANEKTLESNPNLFLGDIIGKNGLEAVFDEEIRGASGIKLIEQDAKGRTLREYIPENEGPVSGSNLHLTIDLEAQRKLNEVLAKGMKEFNASGAVGILENSETGEILAIVSLPDYDSNIYIGGISYEDFNKLQSDPNNPMLNRATYASYPPGSTYKTIVGTAALQEGAITEKTIFQSTGVMFLGTRAFPEFGRKAWGKLNLIDGLAYSSNHYFCHTMLELGIEKFVPYAEWAGFGQKTGIEVLSEKSGIIPSPENKAKLAATRSWLEPTWNEMGDDCNSAIGQGITTVTPIQLTNWAATLANGGYVLRPHLVKSITDEEGLVLKEYGRIVVREPRVSSKNLDSIRKGMRETVVRKIVWPLTGAKVSVAAKTGTAQFGPRNEKGEYTKNHAWVMTIFPYEKPKYSLVIFLEAGYASNNSAKIAREYIDWFADYEGSGLK